MENLALTHGHVAHYIRARARLDKERADRDIPQAQLKKERQELYDALGVGDAWGKEAYSPKTPDRKPKPWPVKSERIGPCRIVSFHPTARPLRRPRGAANANYGRCRTAPLCINGGVIRNASAVWPFTPTRVPRHIQPPVSIWPPAQPMAMSCYGRAIGRTLTLPERRVIDPRHTAQCVAHRCPKRT